MPALVVDAHLAELAFLDVVDVCEDGTLVLNAAFLAGCVEAYDKDPSCLDTVFQERILARAVARGYAGLVDVEWLALAALELDAPEESQTHA